MRTHRTAAPLTLFLISLVPATAQEVATAPPLQHDTVSFQNAGPSFVLQDPGMAGDSELFVEDELFQQDPFFYSQANDPYLAEPAWVDEDLLRNERARTLRDDAQLEALQLLRANRFPTPLTPLFRTMDDERFSRQQLIANLAAWVEIWGSTAPASGSSTTNEQ